MQKLIYYIFRYFIFILHLTPFFILYLYSDILSLLLFNIIGYRKKVVLINLRNSFPEKSEREIYKIAKKFYNHLSDITLESVKGYSLSGKKILKRYTYQYSKVVADYFEQGKDIILAGGHYGNWEWGILMISEILPFKMTGVYNPMTNKYIDKYIKKVRTERGTELVPLNLTKRIFANKCDKPKAIMLVGDQNPSNKNKSIKTTFLNQETFCLHGIELYAKIYSLPVVYYSILKEKRGHYKLTAELITDKPRDMKKGELTKIYMKKLEQTIIAQPEFWLWSHKRWKHNKNNYEL